MVHRRMMLLALPLLPLWAAAQPVEPRPITSLATLSLIGNEMTVDIYRERVGTQLNTNRQTVYPITDPAFDHMALLAASEAARQRLPAAKVITLAVPKAGSAFDPNAMLANPADLAAHPVIQALQQQGYGHLLAITKLRAPASFQLYGQTIGSGPVQGLGFYVDPFLALRRLDTGEVATGFIAPYAYLRLSLVDTASGAVLRQANITASVVQTTAGRPALDVWDVMTPREKVQLLRQFIDRSVRDAVPGLLDRP